MADRFSQMSEQAALIAKKKAEIEAKRVAALEQGSVKGYQQLGAYSSKPSGQGTTSSPVVNTSKNRWGFKGKTAQSEVKASPQAPKLANTFNNDGSFLEQFKKMNETKNPVPLKPEPFRAAPVKVEPSPIAVSNPDIPPEADDWYKVALERARAIANSMLVPTATTVAPPVAPPTAVVPSTPPLPDLKPKLEPKHEPEENGDQAEYGSASAGSSTSSIPKPAASSKDSNPFNGCWSMVKQEAEDPSDDADRDFLPIVAQELASMVALSGDQLEELARARNVGEEELAFLQDVDCDLYKRYRQAVESMRKGMDAEKKTQTAKSGERKKSRWGDKTPVPVPMIPQGVVMPHNNIHAVPGKSPQIIQYAIRVFGSTDLSEDQWRQCEDQIKMSVVYDEMVRKKDALEKLEQQGKRKYEYDSDEDVNGGTWEHKARRMEMEKTAIAATQMTEAGRGRHHIGDFLPPEELTKFMTKFQALQRGEEYDESDYVENKLTNDNLGFKMLQRMGWSEGTGLGSDAQGITNPIGKGSVSSDKKGLGTNVPHELGKDDDEFDAYRKRMMLAYRFRPNPLNNPRRAYY